MKPVTRFVVLGAASLLFACGPAARTGGGDDTHVDAGDEIDTPGECIPQPEICDDGLDNDCDGYPDCYDPECSGIGTCPVCGMVMHPLATPLALPDGAGAGPPYTNALTFSGFGANQTFAAVSNIQSVCVNMEHSWIRDIQVELHAPDPAPGVPGQIIVLQEQLGNECPSGPCEVYLGEANDDDDANSPVPGIGADYCWKPTATNPSMLAYVNGSMPMVTYNGVPELPPGDYASAGSWDALIGAPLNGDWTISVQDKWASDNGYIFSWSIAFDPTIVQECSTPPIQ